MHLNVRIFKPVPNVKHIFYISRSTFSQETTEVAELAIDRYGVDWKVYPFFENEDYCQIEPDIDNGNGIFIAHFGLKSAVIELEAEELQNLSICDLEATELVTPTRVVRKKRPPKIEKSRPSLRLSRQLRNSVKRLSAPRQFIVDGAAAASIKKEKEGSKSSVVDQEITISTDAKIDNDAQKAFEEMDIGIFGISLKRFYHPMAEALALIEKSKPSAFPVPNPRPWK
jgi:hypothetical protein